MLAQVAASAVGYPVASPVSFLRFKWRISGCLTTNQEEQAEKRSRYAEDQIPHALADTAGQCGSANLRYGLGVSNFLPFTPNSPLDALLPPGAVCRKQHRRPTLDSNRYGSLASQVYELDKPVGHGFGDVEFYLAALRDLSGPVLEPAVGSGRVLIPLLRAGLDVDGFDASPEMLAICRENCKAAGLTTRLSHARFEDFNCDREHAAIDVPAGSFQLITSFKAAIAVLERFHAHLTTGGRLLIDLSVASGIYQAGRRASALV